MTIWAVIPVKPLHTSKSRLAHLLSPDERAALIYQFLDRTLSILAQVQTIAATLIVSSDPDVLTLAHQQQAATLPEEKAQGLNKAVTKATQYLQNLSVSAMLILPADLPFIQPSDIDNMVQSYRAQDGLSQPVMAICTDDQNDGTNALLLPTHVNFIFQYGRNSFHYHIREAVRLGLTPHVVHAPGLQFDLDTENDWKNFKRRIPCPQIE